VDPATQTAVITDNSSVTVLFESVALTVAENDSFVEACVVLLHTNLQRSFAIDLVPQSGTATSELDFNPLPTQIEFDSGTQGRECFQVQIMDDDTFEDLETFLIVMSTLDSAVEIPQPELIVTIQDNDRVVVSFTETEYVVNESDLLLEVCVSLDGATEVPVSVMLALQPDDQLSHDMMATCKR
jgi:hypothetical protein